MHKKISTNRGNKIDKKINKHHKSSCRYQNDAYRKPVSQQEAKSVKENCAKPASNIKENLQQIKQMKSEVFGTKIKQAVYKRIAKNKASKQLDI